MDNSIQPQPKFQISLIRMAGGEHVSDLGWLQNCQDGRYASVVTIGGKQYIVGAVSDGCSAGQHNEVGALLLPRFVVGEIILLLTNGVPLKEVPNNLFPRVLGFLRFIPGMINFSSPIEMIEFVENYLMATLLGFIIGPDEGVAFRCADGVLIINDEEYVFEQNDKPTYPAYWLINQRFLGQSGTEKPHGFETFLFETANLQVLAVATDGSTPAQLRQLLGGKKPVNAQKKVNAMQWGERTFSDDVGGILIERIPESEAPK